MSECSIEGCDRPGHCRGWCVMHYTRWRRHGDISVGGWRTKKARRYKPLPLSRPPTPLETMCREYWGPHDKDGYGLRNGYKKVHVWVWEQINGPVPKGMFIMHRCDNPPCFRYDHLLLGTPGDNTADMIAKGRHKKGTTNA